MKFMRATCEVHENHCIHNANPDMIATVGLILTSIDRLNLKPHTGSIVDRNKRIVVQPKP
jgi:hypothetical protein